MRCYQRLAYIRLVCDSVYASRVYARTVHNKNPHKRNRRRQLHVETLRDINCQKSDTLRPSHTKPMRNRIHLSMHSIADKADTILFSRYSPLEPFSCVSSVSFILRTETILFCVQLSYQKHYFWEYWFLLLVTLFDFTAQQNFHAIFKNKFQSLQSVAKSKRGN